jgi:N-acetylmuramoyl-L-alanine amidase
MRAAIWIGSRVFEEVVAVRSRSLTGSGALHFAARAALGWAAALSACDAGGDHRAPPQQQPAPAPSARTAEPVLAQTPVATAATTVPPLPTADGDVVGEAAIASWARRIGAHATASLEEISVYGGRAPGEQPQPEREVRVVLRFDGVAVYRRGELPAGGGLPRRLVLDLDNVSLTPRVPSMLPVSAGGLDRVRVFALDDAQTRVAFDVGPTTAYRLFFLSEPYRVVMDFRDRVPRVSTSGARVWRIVIDPGHGGDQPGAKGPNGLREDAVALALARRVQRSLTRQLPDANIVMTRNDGRFVSLEERAAIANAVAADLFVSIHLNAAPSPDDEGGVSTFVLDTTSDQAALRLAARENGTGTEGVTQLQMILASLYRNDQVQRSLALAGEVQTSVLRGGRRVLPDLKDRGVKRALFYVLVGAQMPAVLVEASFITRPTEAAALETDGYRQALADGIAEGVAQYVQRERLQARK